MSITFFMVLQMFAVAVVVALVWWVASAGNGRRVRGRE